MLFNHLIFLFSGFKMHQNRRLSLDPFFENDDDTNPVKKFDVLSFLNYLTNKHANHIVTLDLSALHSIFEVSLL
jgi:hypothetical protein